MGKNNKKYQENIETSSIDDEHIEMIEEQPKQQEEPIKEKKKRVMTQEQLDHLAKCRELAKQKKKQLAEANPKSRLHKHLQHQEVLEQAKEIDQLVDKKIEEHKKAIPTDFIVKDARYYKEKYNRLKSDYRNLQTTTTNNNVSMKERIQKESNNKLVQDLERERLRLSAMNLFGRSDFI